MLGVWALIDVQWSSDPWGLFRAALNAALFTGYVVLGHRASGDGAGDGIERLGAAMAIALVLLPPIGFGQAAATIIGAIVLGQVPGAADLAGIALVMAGVAVHQPTRIG